MIVKDENAKDDIKNENKILLAVFLFVLAIYILFLSNSLNFYDALTYAKSIRNAFENKDILLPFTSFGAYGPGSMQGLGRSSLYVLFSYLYTFLFTNILHSDYDFALNSFSAIAAAFSIIFVYKIARLYLNKKLSVISSLIYAVTPFVFFIGINSSNYSLLLPFSAAWAYYLLLSLKTGNQNYGLLSSFLVVANIFIHPLSLPLLLPHAYGILKISRKIKLKWLVKNAVALSPAAILIFYFYFVNPAYPLSTNFLTVLFETAIFGYELINGLSVIFFAAFALSFLFLLKRLFVRKADTFDIFFFLTFVGLCSSLFYFNDIPVVRFISIFPMLPIFVIREFKNLTSFRNFRYFNFLVYMIIIFMLIKFLPLAYQFHIFPHPHKAYALWLATFNPPLVILGHECPFVDFYTDLNFVCKSTQQLNVTLPATGVYVTEEYFNNENEMEFEFMQNMMHLPFNNEVESRIQKQDFLKGKTFEKTAIYNGDLRSFEDMFQWMFTVYPNPATNLIINTAFIKPQYAIYNVS